MKKTKQLTICSLILLILTSILASVPIHAYDDYENWYVDPQNPEVQKMIRDYCKFPLEDNLISNARILFYALGWRFSYDYTMVHARQTIPEMFRQEQGVCCDFARLYYSLLRGIGWPAHRVEIVHAPSYWPIIDEPIIEDGRHIGHAWVEIKLPSPSGTALAFSANQSLSTLEGEHLIVGCNGTMVELPEFTEERIEEIRSLGWGTRDGWIPIDPTTVCGVPWWPFLFDLYLNFGYSLFFGTIHLDEVEPHYPAPWRRENPIWYGHPYNLTVTLEPQQAFNVSYLRSVQRERLNEKYLMALRLRCSANSTLPIDFKIEKQCPQELEIIDEVLGTDNYDYNVTLGYRSDPFTFPEDIGIYWFTGYNPQTETVNVTFSLNEPSMMAWFNAETAINQTLYDQYSLRDIGITNVRPHTNSVYQDNMLPIYVTLQNYGFTTETFNVTIYANTTIVNTIINETLTSGQTRTLGRNWHTIGFPLGNYTIKAEVTTVPNETDISDNTFTDGIVEVIVYDGNGGGGGDPPLFTPDSNSHG